MKFEVIDIKDSEDGSAILTVDMDEDTLKRFASIGLLKVLKDAAIDTLETKEQTNQLVETYIDNAIKIIENRTKVSSTILCDEQKIIDLLAEVCQDVLNTLLVAKSMFNAKKS